MNAGTHASNGSYRPGNLLMRPSDMPVWSNPNPKSSSPIRPSTSTAGTATTRQGAPIPNIRNNNVSREVSPVSVTYNQIIHRNSVQNVLNEKDNNLK